MQEFSSICCIFTIRSMFKMRVIKLSFFALMMAATTLCIFKRRLAGVSFNIAFFTWFFFFQTKSYSIVSIVSITSLTLTLPSPSAGVSGFLDSYCSLKPLCLGMGEVVPARTSPTLLPPSPRTVLSLSCFKVLQCINCRDWHFKG